MADECSLTPYRGREEIKWSRIREVKRGQEKKRWEEKRRKVEDSNKNFREKWSEGGGQVTGEEVGVHMFPRGPGHIKSLFGL